MSKTHSIPADLAASAARVRDLVLAAGVTQRDLDTAAARAYDAIVRDQDALAKLGAPLYDVSAEMRAAGVPQRDREAYSRQVRRAIDLAPGVADWAALCRASSILLAAQATADARVDDGSALRAARRTVHTTAMGVAA